MAALVVEPTIFSFITPSLKNSSVGMLRMPNFMGMSVDSSTLHFAMSHLPSYSLDSSAAGAAPGCPEIQKHRNLGVDNHFLEIGIVDC